MNTIIIITLVVITVILGLGVGQALLIHGLKRRDRDLFALYEYIYDYLLNKAIANDVPIEDIIIILNTARQSYNESISKYGTALPMVEMTDTLETIKNESRAEYNRLA